MQSFIVPPKPKAMESFNLKKKLKLTFIPFHLLLLFTLFTCNLKASSAQSINPFIGAACMIVNCGQGMCKADNAPILGFDCECYSGWKKFQIGPLTFPSCVVPNCTFGLQCGNGSPSPPPPPAPVLPPPPNPSDPCAYIWCGEGKCVTNGTGYTCQCNEGSANLFNLTNAACFKACSFGADCNGLGFGPPASPPPPPSSSGSPDGSSAIPNCLRNLHALTMIMLAAIFLTWT